MDKSLFFIVMFLSCIWLIVDDLIGQKRLTQFAATIAPDWKPFAPVKDKIDEMNENWDKNMEEKPTYWHELQKEVEKNNPWGEKMT